MLRGGQERALFPRSPINPAGQCPPSPSPVPTLGPHQGWPYSWSRSGEQTSVFTTVTISPTAALVWAKHSFMFSVILSWGREGGTSAGRGSKRQGKRGEWREGKRGSHGVWLPSLPSLEEALENTDNKNSCSRAKRKCHFYPGLVLGTTGATSPMGSGAGRSSGQEAGLRRTAWTPSPEGKGYEGPIGASTQNFAAWGNRGGIRSSPAGAKGEQTDEMAPEPRAAEPLTQGCQGMQPGMLCQLRAGTGGAWLLKGGGSPRGRP